MGFGGTCGHYLKNAGAGINQPPLTCFDFMIFTNVLVDLVLVDKNLLPPGGFELRIKRGMCTFLFKHLC